MLAKSSSPSIVAKRASPSAALRNVVRQSGVWLPGAERPSYLPESMIGSYGFDPLGFGKDPAALARFQSAEIIHGRWAMLGVVGAIVPEILGYGNWYEAQAWALTPGAKATYIGMENPLSFVQVAIFMTVSFGAAEGFRANAPLEKKTYPGFDFLNMDSDDRKLKEIKNGRLAMVAFVGFFAEHSATTKGPIAALTEHLASPFTANFATNGVSVPGL